MPHLFNRCLRRSCSGTTKKRRLSGTSCSCWETRWSCRTSRGETRSLQRPPPKSTRIHIHTTLLMFLYSEPSLSSCESNQGLLCCSIFRSGGFVHVFCCLHPRAGFEEVWMCHMVRLVLSLSTPSTDSRRSCSMCPPSCPSPREMHSR